jgi:hypothetical protein
MLSPQKCGVTVLAMLLVLESWRKGLHINKRTIRPAHLRTRAHKLTFGRIRKPDDH